MSTNAISIVSNIIVYIAPPICPKLSWLQSLQRIYDFLVPNTEKENTISILILHLIEIVGSLASENKLSLGFHGTAIIMVLLPHPWLYLLCVLYSLLFLCPFFEHRHCPMTSHELSAFLALQTPPILTPVPNCLGSGPQLFSTIFKKSICILEACLWMSTIYSCNSSRFTKDLLYIMHCSMLLAI